MSVQRLLEEAVANGRAVVHTLRVDESAPGARMLVWPNGERTGSLGAPALDEIVTQDALDLLNANRRETREYPEHQARVFIEPLLSPPHLVIFGGVHIAIPLVTFAKTLGYRVTIVDPRTKFANRERFPHADAIIPLWPDKAVEQLEMTPSTAFVILTHDPKIDEPALKSVVGKGAGYVGAIGSRKTHAERFRRMAQHGLSTDDLREVYAPIGLDLKAETPEEIALAIMAEIVAVMRGGRGGFLRDAFWRTMGDAIADNTQTT
nr:XdhC/CoxI family protein [Ardenticatena sp.]